MINDPFTLNMHVPTTPCIDKDRPFITLNLYRPACPYRFPICPLTHSTLHASHASLASLLYFPILFSLFLKPLPPPPFFFGPFLPCLPFTHSPFPTYFRESRCSPALHLPTFTSHTQPLPPRNLPYHSIFQRTAFPLISLPSLSNTPLFQFLF